MEREVADLRQEVTQLKAHLNYIVNDVKEIKADVKMNEAALVTQSTELAVTKADIREIRDFMVKSDARAQGNTKLLITTLITTVTMLISFLGTVYVTMTFG